MNVSFKITIDGIFMYKFYFLFDNDKNFVKPRLKMTEYRVFLSHRHMRNSRLCGEDESREQLHVLCQVMLSKRRFYAEKLWCPPADSRPLSSTTPKYDLQNIVSYIRCDFSGLKFSFCWNCSKKSVILKILFFYLRLEKKIYPIQHVQSEFIKILLNFNIKMY